MTTLNQGLNVYRNAIEATIATVEIGTGTTPETVADTALQAPIASLAATTFSAGVGEFVTRGRLGAGDHNGETVAEVGLRTASTLTTRRTHAPIHKTALIEIEWEILTRVRNKT